MPQSHRGGLLLRIIAIFKFLKAALLIAAGVGALHLVNRDITGYAENLVVRYHLNRAITLSRRPWNAPPTSLLGDCTRLGRSLSSMLACFCWRGSVSGV